MKLPMQLQWPALWVIFCKEVIDNIRDKRSVLTILFSVIATPILYIGFIFFIEQETAGKIDPLNAEPISLPVIGTEYAPNLMRALQKHHIEIESIPADTDTTAALQTGEYLMVLKVDKHYPQAIEKGEIAPLVLIHDSTKSGLDKIGLKVVKGAIAEHAQTIGALRLISRGIDPQIVRTIQVNESDIADASLKGVELLKILPYFLIIFIMTGGMYLAIDSTAGEREKGSLESLIIQPPSRATIVSSKLLATAFFSFLTVVLAIIALAIAFEYSPAENLQFSLSVQQVVTLAITALPLCILLSAVMILLSSFTKSFKEAQTYLSYAMMIPMLPMFWLMFASPQPELQNMWIPILSQALIILSVIKDEIVANHLIGVSFLVTSVLAFFACYISIKLYQRERILG